MTVATLLLTCLIFYAQHWTRTEDQLAALSVAAVVCVAASNGGTTSQDLKTGYLVGATPIAQHRAILIGTLTSALVIGVILIVLNRAGTVFSTPANLPVPKTAIDVKQARLSWNMPLATRRSIHVWRPTENNPQGVPCAGRVSRRRLGPHSLSRRSEHQRQARAARRRHRAAAVHGPEGRS